MLTRSVPEKIGAKKQEIVTEVHNGKTDDEILNGMTARYGSTILVAPAFRGFNMLLWMVHPDRENRLHLAVRERDSSL